MKKRKLFIVCSIIAVLVLQTIQIQAMELEINTEEENIEIEENVGRSDQTWFDSTTGITYRYNTNTLTGTVVRYTGGNREQLTVASQFTIANPNRTIIITGIEESAFRGVQIRSIQLPTHLKTIGIQAFSGNIALRNINIPDSVTSIGIRAFANCTALAEVRLSNSITTIQREAFSDTALTAVEIPNSVREIGMSAFKGNRLSSVNIPNSVSTIGHSAFRGNQLTHITLPNSLRIIENYSFSDNRLSSITIDNSVTTIGEHAFSNNQLQNVTIHNSVRIIENHAFYNNKILSVELPRSITSIGSSAFEINHLTSVFIPNTVTSIGSGAFQLNPLTTIQTDDGNADFLRARLGSMGTLSVPIVSLKESSPTRYEDNVQTVNNVFTGSNLELHTIPQTKYVYNNNTSIWHTYVPVVQWYRNGIPLPGKNNVTLSLPNIQESDSGTYHAVVDSTVLPNITVNVTTVYPLSELFPDVNFAKAIAQVLHGNENTNIQVSLKELADITNLDLSGKGIQNLKGTEYLVNIHTLNLSNNKIQDVIPLIKSNKLQVLILNNNQINNIKPLSTLHIIVLQATNQTIQLPEEIRGEPTDLQLVDIDGSTPPVTFVQGQGTYTNGKLTWSTSGENQLTWRGNNFTGTVTQTVQDRQYPISTFFPDENLAKEIAQVLHENHNISALTTETELAKINILNIPQKGIKDLTGIDYLINLANINASGNHIHDIRLLSKLPNIANYDFTNQTILLPEGVRGQSTDIHLVNMNGTTPFITFVKGEGTYVNGKLTWNTAGENQLTWQGIQFSGTLTQNVKDIGLPITNFFPDENLAKVIAQALDKNDISALITETELATIDFLNIPNMGIKDLTGIDHLKYLVFINAPGNHISDIRILSKLPNAMYNFLNQTIPLPEGVPGEPTDVQLVGRDGFTPLITFEKGEGTYENGKLTWTTGGENQLTWQESTNFSGTLTQNVKDKGLPISNFFPDENLAKEIAQALDKNDISALTTETELAKINKLNISQKGIKNLTGIDHLKNLTFIAANGNHIHDISIVSKLQNLFIYNFTNQTIQLPGGVRGEPTDISLVNINGTTPSISYEKGEGTYVDGKLTWSSVGENQLTWQSPQFSGTITQTTIPPIPPAGQTIASLFPDENLAKEIAQVLHSNQDTSVNITNEQLLTINILSLSKKGIKNLSGVEKLKSLLALDISHNHIHDISMLSELPNLMLIMAFGQTITLPVVTVGTPTKLTIRNEKGVAPNHTFAVGQGTYVNGELQWTTAGENQLTWHSSYLLGTFDGKIIQNVVQPNQTMASMFLDTSNLPNMKINSGVQ